MTRRAPVLMFSVAMLSLLAPMKAGATITRAVSFDQKVENAASIVLGRCVRQESRWDDAKKWILTYSTFEVEKSIKGGSGPGEVTIVTPGGRVGDVAQEVIGVPRFREGDEHVLFVRNSQVGPTVLYLEQGAYRVVEERGERLVMPVSSNAVVVDSQRGVAVQRDGTHTLREFESRVKDTVQRRQKVEMDLLEEKKREEASIWNHLKRNMPLVLLALVGAALATWQLTRRT